MRTGAVSLLRSLEASENRTQCVNAGKTYSLLLDAHRPIEPADSAANSTATPTNWVFPVNTSPKEARGSNLDSRNGDPMRRLNQTILFSSLLALGCGADVGATDDQMGGVLPGEPAVNPPVTPGVPTSSNTPGVTPPGPTGVGVDPGTPGTTPGTTTPPPPPPPATECQPGIPGTSQVPRLSNEQYDRTVFDLVGVEPSGLLAAEQEGAMNKTVWDSYITSAEFIANAVMGDAALKAKFMKCTPAGDGTDCLKQTIVDFGKRAYRRPLSAEEIADFDEHILSRREELTESNTADQVAELILSTFLQSPGFLLRSELGQDTDAQGNFTLSSYEVASRLSYMIWNTMPDDALFAAADAGELQTKAQVLAQAQRMVADDKARFVARTFHDRYIHLTDSQQADRWTATTKDATLFPAFVPQVTSDMIVEMQMLFDDVFTSGGAFQDLLLTKDAYVTSATAPIYGVTGNFTATHTKTQLDDTRPGFLTRIGFLAAFSNINRNNPIVRGAFITKDVLGVDPGAAIPGAASTPLPEDPNLDTLRKRVDAMTAATGCTECHGPFINPPGFVMEAFDSSGAAQATDRTVIQAGAPIDPAADVKTSYDGEPVRVSSPAELMTLIANAESAQRLYASKWVGFAFNRVLTAPDLCTVDVLGTKIAAGGYSIQNLISDLTQQDYFLTRAVEVTQ